jgi:hypothetical protein
MRHHAAFADLIAVPVDDALSVLDTRSTFSMPVHFNVPRMSIISDGWRILPVNRRAKTEIELMAVASPLFPLSLNVWLPKYVSECSHSVSRIEWIRSPFQNELQESTSARSSITSRLACGRSSPKTQVVGDTPQKSRRFAARRDPSYRTSDAYKF